MEYGEGYMHMVMMLNRSSRDDIKEGMRAYGRYHRIMRHLAAEHGFPLHKVVAAFVSLSPNSGIRVSACSASSMKRNSTCGQPMNLHYLNPIQSDDLWWLDPNNWPLNPPHQFRIYGDDLAQSWCIVDEEDYADCVQYRWGWKVSRGDTKKYLYRNRHVNWQNGGDARLNRTQENLFLHTYILEERMGVLRPSPKHIVDHKNGNHHDCRRKNLRWATIIQNRRNRNGQNARHTF